MMAYALGPGGRLAIVVGGMALVMVVCIVVVCAVISPCLLNSMIRREEERRRQHRQEKRPLVRPPPTLQLSTPNSKRPSDPFIASPDNKDVNSPSMSNSPHLNSPYSPGGRVDGGLLGALANKRDSTYSSMSEYSMSPLQSGRNSLCDSTGYASLVTSPTVDCASPLPYASGQLSIAIKYRAIYAESSKDSTADNREGATVDVSGKLSVRVLDARGISHPYLPATSAPPVYVRVLIWREKRGLRRIKTTHLNVFRTRTIRHTFDPTFNETFVADIGKIDPKELVVRLVLESQDRWVCSTVLGESTISLRVLPSNAFSMEECKENGEKNDNEEDGRNLDTFGSPLTYCLSPPAQELGNLLISCSYLPTAQRLSVCIIKAAELKLTVASKGINDFYPYVRVLLLHKGRLVNKKKTGFCSNEASPQWNQTLIFSLQPMQVEHACVIICVCSRSPPPSPKNNNNDGHPGIHNPFNDNEKHNINKTNNNDNESSAKGIERYVGKVVLGPQVRVLQAREFYKTVVQTPRTQHTQWHALR